MELPIDQSDLSELLSFCNFYCIQLTLLLLPPTAVAGRFLFAVDNAEDRDGDEACHDSVREHNEPLTSGPKKKLRILETKEN